MKIKQNESLRPPHNRQRHPARLFAHMVQETNARINLDLLIKLGVEVQRELNVRLVRDALHSGNSCVLHAVKGECK